MDKTDIKYMLRESLVALSEDKEKKGKKKNKDSKKGEKEVQYADVTNFLDDHPTISKVGAFREAGFSEKEIYNRLPYKKLEKDENEMGGTYSFDKDEVDKLRTVLTKYPGGGKLK